MAGIQETLITILEEHDFSVYVDNDYVEVETWTDGGVNMIMSLDYETLYDDLVMYLEDYDIDEQVDYHREMSDYAEAFTVDESIEDFRSFGDRLTNLHRDIVERLG